MIDIAGEHSSGRAPNRRGWAVSHAAGIPVAAIDSDIRLTLPARAENLAVVRSVLGALAEALDLPQGVTADLRLAATEACSNVVRHAYGNGTGTIDVVVRSSGDALEVIVTDAGRGIGPSLDTTGPGLGLPLIAALADSLEIERPARRGSRLVMSFRSSPAMGFA